MLLSMALVPLEPHPFREILYIVVTVAVNWSVSGNGHGCAVLTMMMVGKVLTADSEVQRKISREFFSK